MYRTEAKGYTWSSTVHGRGARSVLVTQGTYVIDHISSGWFITGNSRTVSADVDKQIDLLRKGKHPNRKLQQQYSWEPDIKLIEYPMNTAKESKKLEAEIRSTNDTAYCLLN
ncbi:hypothetical protein D9M71_340530 [compost metagenome]